MGGRWDSCIIAAMRAITPQEVAMHTTESDCWMIIDGKVYDVTGFLNQHPAGPALLLEHAGEDATDEFESVGHFDHALGLLADMVIGDLDRSMEDARVGLSHDSKDILDGTLLEGVSVSCRDLEAGNASEAESDALVPKSDSWRGEGRESLKQPWCPFADCGISVCLIRLRIMLQRIGW